MLPAAEAASTSCHLQRPESGDRRRHCRTRRSALFTHQSNLHIASRSASYRRRRWCDQAVGSKSLGIGKGQRACEGVQTSLGVYLGSFVRGGEKAAVDDQVRLLPLAESHAVR